MKPHEDFSFSDLIRSEFEAIFPSQHLESQESNENDSVLPIEENLKINQRNYNPETFQETSSLLRRKWYPGRRWDDEELKSFLTIDYNIERYEIPMHHENTQNKQKKQETLKTISISLNDIPPMNQNISLVDLKESKQLPLVSFSINTNVQKSIQLQYYLVELNDETFEETANTLYNMNYFTSRQNIQKLLYEIISVISIRKEKVHLFVRLIQYIITKSNNIFPPEYCADYDYVIPVTTESIILNVLLKPCGDDNFEYLTNVPKLFLLKHCMNAGVITPGQITSSFEEVISQYPIRTNFHNLVFCFFAPQIEAYNKALSDKIFRKIDSTSWYSSTQLKGTLNEFYDLRKKHWKGMNELTENGLLTGSIEQIIEQDNLEALKREFQKGAADRNCWRTVFWPNIWAQRDMNMIEWSAVCGSLSIFQYLIPNEKELTKLAPFAIAGGNPKIYDLCKKNENQRQSLLAAAHFRRYSIFDNLLKYARKNDYNELLVFCSKANNLRGCQSCINAGGNINYHSSSENDMTALHESAKYGHIDLTSYLLACSFINVNSTDNDKNTPLHLAALNNRYEIICLLLAVDDVNVNAVNINKRTALHEAAVNGCIECIKILASSKKIDLNLKDSKGMTAIMCANRNGQTIVRDFLSSLPNIESDLTQKKITYATAAKLISSTDDFSKNELSTDELSQDFSYDALLFTEDQYQKYLQK